MAQSPETSQPSDVTIREELPHWETQKELQNYKMYNIGLQNEANSPLVGYFYTSPEGTTLAWDGNCPPSQLEATFTALSQHITQGRAIHIADEQARLGIQVNFLLQDEDGCATHEALVLRDKQQFEKYKDILAEPQNVQFARFDVAQDDISFAFTVEYLESHSDGQTELTVQIPHSQRWNDNTIGFVMATHIDTSLQHKPEFHASLAEVLNRKSSADRAMIVAKAHQPSRATNPGDISTNVVYESSLEDHSLFGFGEIDMSIPAEYDDPQFRANPTNNTIDSRE